MSADNIKKTSNWTGNELANIKGMLQRLKEQIGLDKLRKVANKTQYKFYGKPILPNSYYYINIKNPLADFSHNIKERHLGGKKYISIRLAKTKFPPRVPNGYGDTTWGKYEAPMSSDLLDLECIGVSDSEGKKIYLIGVFNNQNPPYITYKNRSWYLTVEGLKYYKIQCDFMFGLKSNPFTTPISDKAENGITVYVPDENINVIYNLTQIKQALAYYDDEEMKEKARREEEERKRKEEQEEYERKKKEWEEKERKEKEKLKFIYDNYEDVGSEGMYTKITNQELYNKMQGHKDTHYICVSYNTYLYSNSTYGHGVYYNDTLKAYYTSSWDSGD